MAWSAEDLVQREHNFAIVDEVDSILVDEARTPLIISGPAEQSAKWYTEFARLAERLRRDTDYEVDEKKRTLGVLESGVEKVEDWLGMDNLYESANTPLVGYLNNALKAKELYKHDKDYVVIDGEVLIVDEHTGRMLAGRRYNEGMHQAIEAKEGVKIKDENQTLATITLQNFFRMYDKLAGMTGTAMTEAAEFGQIYNLGVVPIPTNMPMIRIDQSDLIYKTEEAKFNAVIDDIVDRNENGQPVLIGTVSVEKSELLSSALKKRGVKHEVLNAKQHQREASIIAMAGRKGAVTVATNMAGRGTDIMLGGNAEFSATEALHKQGLNAAEQPEEFEAAWPEALEAAQAAVKAEHEEVTELGGLYVLGTERHESRRIDNQLRGRSGRQGDPGESRFYLSLQDDLMRRFKSELVERVFTTFNMPDDEPIESKMVSKSIVSAQGQVEGQNFEIRKNVLKYDEVLNNQRTVIYQERRRVLEGEDLHEQVEHMINDTIEAYVVGATSDGYAEEWDLDALWVALKQLYPISYTVESIIEEAGGIDAPVDRLPRQDAPGGRAARVRGARGDPRRRGDPRARAPRRALRARPQVARAPLRDGLPQGGHRPAGDGPAQPAGRVPEGGLRPLQRDDGRHQGGVRRLRLQPRGQGQRAPTPTTDEDTSRRRLPRTPTTRSTRSTTASSSSARPGRRRWRRPARSPSRSARSPRRRRRRHQQAHAPDRDREGARPAGSRTAAAVLRADRRRRHHHDDGRRPDPGERRPQGQRNADQGRRPVRERDPQRPCPCGSGKKYKRCHGDPRTRV